HLHGESHLTTAPLSRSAHSLQLEFSPPAHRMPFDRRKRIARTKLPPMAVSTYMDIGKVFLQADGSIPRETMNDHLDPTRAGYERWGEAIAPTLKKLLAN